MKRLNVIWADCNHITSLTFFRQCFYKWIICPFISQSTTQSLQHHHLHIHTLTTVYSPLHTHSATCLAPHQALGTSSISLMSSNYLPYLLFSPMWLSSCLSSHSFCHVTITSDTTATSDFDNVSVLFQATESRDASHSSPEFLDAHRLTELVGYFLWRKLEKFHGWQRCRNSV